MIMDNYRSKSCRDGREMQQLEEYKYGGGRDLAGASAAPSGMNHLTRSYTTNHTFSSSFSSVHPPRPPPPPGGGGDYNMISKERDMKKSNEGGSMSKSWSFNDPELKRKKRIAGYKVYTVEGKMKGSLRKSFRWIKDILHGWRSWGASCLSLFQ